MKIPTQWLPPNRQGSSEITPSYQITDNVGNNLVDNLGNYLVTNTTQLVPKPDTSWYLPPPTDALQAEDSSYILGELLQYIEAEDSVTVYRPETQWFTGSRFGSVQIGSNLLFTDNLGNFLVDNSGNNLVTTTLIVVPKPSTSWEEV